MTDHPDHPDPHRRRSLRLQGHDYAQAGAYFVTLCTWGRECLFGKIVDGQMLLNDVGRVVSDQWFKTGQIRENVHLNLDEFVVMPNHVHGIVWIVAVPGATRRVAPTSHPVVPTSHPVVPTSHPVVPTSHPVVRTSHPAADTGSGPRPTGPVSGSVGAIMAQFKSVVTKQINALRGTSGTQVWQRNYHEHIIRNDESLNRIREYIVNNPLQWALDRENPANTAPTQRM